MAINRPMRILTWIRSPEVQTINESLLHVKRKMVAFEINPELSETALEATNLYY
jgi:hypothetical protein